MIKTTVPRGRSNSSKGMGNSSMGGYSTGRWSERPEKTHCVQWVGAIRPDDPFLVVKSFTDKPNGSNSIEQQLSVVK
jgi:hypothetical protein